MSPKESFDRSAVVPDNRQPRKVQLFDPAQPGAWRGNILGDTLGARSTIIAYGNDTPGEGPVLHVHPYDEIFIIVEGRARFYVGDQVIEAAAGEAVLGPRGIPHRFENMGPGRLQTIDIHLGYRWLQIDL